MTFPCTYAPLLCAGLLSAGLVTSCKKNDPIKQAAAADKAAGIAAPGLDEVKAIAEEGFIYGLPLVMNYAVMNEMAVDPDSGQFKAPFNTIDNADHVFTYEDTAVVTPNSDTPYSVIWLDLRAEPMVVSVPAVEKERYYSVQLIDGNTYNYGYIGTRTTGSDPGDYLVVGPGWKGESPAGIRKVFQSTTPIGITIFRTQLFNAADMPNVLKVQAGYKVQPLSAFLKQPAPPAAAKTDFVPANNKGIKANFYQYLDAALEYVPEAPEDQAIRARLARIGIGPGKTFNFKDLSPEFGQLHAELMSERFQKILQRITGQPVFVDPDFHGGGIHQGGEGSYLDMHADFNTHPLHTDWFRNLNILLYLNKDWQPAYKGQLKLRHRDRPETTLEVEPRFNRCVIMFTRDFTLQVQQA